MGDVVAVVEPGSTPARPLVHLGKVLKLARGMATLGWLKPADGKKNTYKFCIGRQAWREKVAALVHPVDTAYCHKTDLYTLRTPLLDIHHYIIP